MKQKRSRKGKTNQKRAVARARQAKPRETSKASKAEKWMSRCIMVRWTRKPGTSCYRYAECYVSPYIMKDSGKAWHQHVCWSFTDADIFAAQTAYRRTVKGCIGADWRVDANKVTFVGIMNLRGSVEHNRTESKTRVELQKRRRRQIVSFRVDTCYVTRRVDASHAKRTWQPVQF